MKCSLHSKRHSQNSRGYLVQTILRLVLGLYSIECRARIRLQWCLRFFGRPGVLIMGLGFFRILEAYIQLIISRIIRPFKFVAHLAESLHAVLRRENSPESRGADFQCDLEAARGWMSSEHDRRIQSKTCFEDSKHTHYKFRHDIYQYNKINCITTDRPNTQDCQRPRFA